MRISFSPDFREEHRRDLYEIVSEIIEELDFLDPIGLGANLPFSTEVEEWGRERVLFLIVGSIALFTNSDEYRELVFWTQRHKLLAKILRPDLDEYTPVLASRAFDFVRAQDSWIRQSCPEHAHLFRDPLVFFRLASCRYMAGHYQAAANVLLSFLDGSCNREFDWNSPLIAVPDRGNFYVRVVEYLWYACELVDDEILAHLSTIKACLEESKKTKEKYVKMKCASWIILIHAYTDAVGLKSTESFLELFIWAKRILSGANIRKLSENRPYALMASGLLELFASQYDSALLRFEQAQDRMRERLNHPAGATKILRTMNSFFTEIVHSRKALDDIEKLSDAEIFEKTSKSAQFIGAFVSYARADKETVDPIADVLYDAGVHIWRDTEQNLPGSSFIEGLERALANSSLAILFYSSKSARRSGFVHMERNFLKFRRSAADGFPIIVVLLDAKISVFQTENPLLADLHVLEYDGNPRDFGLKLVRAISKITLP